MSYIPQEAQKFAFVLLLSFLIGLEHEEHKQDLPTDYSFGGIRTFPFLGILGYMTAILSSKQPVLSMGLLVVGALMVSSFLHKAKIKASAGMTSEISGILTYLLGGVVYEEHYWIATTVVVVGVFLLELKTAMERLAKQIPPAELLTFTKFLLLTAVIFPILPNVPLTRFQINPHQAWVIVVALSALSYGGYILQRLIGDRGTIASALLGGAYSSTMATVALARNSRGQDRPHLYAGAILAASGAMYLRLAVLVSIFSSSLRTRLAPALCALGLIGAFSGALWARRSDGQASQNASGTISKNPLEIHMALLFAALFVSMLVLTHLVLTALGTIGVYALSVVTGVTDVDPFIMGLIQSSGTNTPILVATAGILIATSSNNIMKGIYALSLSDRDTGRQTFLALFGLSVLGLLALIPIS